MSNSTEQFLQLLKVANLSSTAARNKVFATLKDNPPLSMGELVVMLSGEIDRASVYRTIELFETLGIAQRINFGWKYKLELTDTFHDHHHHLACTNCGKIVDIAEDSNIERYMQKLSREHGFKMAAHQLEIQGLCQECQQRPL